MNFSPLNSYTYLNKPQSQCLLDTLSLPCRQVLGGRNISAHMEEKSLSTAMRVSLAAIYILLAPVTIISATAFLLKSITFNSERKKVEADFEGPIKSSNASLKQLLKHYTLHSHNVSSIEEAEVILLGETHISKEHPVLNSALIKALYRPQDIVLLECSAADSVDHSPVTHLDVPYTSKGWDQADVRKNFMEYNQKIRSFIEAANFVNELDEVNHIDLNQVRELLKLYPQYRETDDFLEETEKDFGSLSPKELDKIAGIILFSIAREWYFFNMYQVNATFVERNVSLADQINLNYFEGRRVFVIAGSLHLISAVNYGMKNQPFEEKAIGVLHEELRTKKYIILNPKFSPTSFVSCSEIASVVLSIPKNIYLGIRSLFDRQPVKFNVDCEGLWGAECELERIAYHYRSNATEVNSIRDKYSQPLPDEVYSPA